MSWLYTLVFAGLMVSSPGAASPTAVNGNLAEPAPAAVILQDETEKFEQSYPLNANGRVSISNVNGSIVVEAWDRNEVKLQYTKTADSRERLADVEVKIDARQDYFSAETDYTSWKGRNDGDRWKNGGKLNVEFRLMVPRGAALNEVETVNGSVTVSNFVNLTKVSAVNGTVMATNIRGTAKLETVNGEVKADFDRLESGSKISLETVNGKVNLTLPSDANATLKADSLNGEISNDFGLPVRKGKYVGRDLYGKLGGGDVQVRLSSVNGSLSVLRKNDGKSVSPAVNLLQQKDTDDTDWDDSRDPQKAMIDAAKLDREVARATKDGMRAAARVTADAARAAADARRELDRIRPEIAMATSKSIQSAADALQQTAQTFNTEAISQRIIDAQTQQRIAMTAMADRVFSGIPRIEKKSESFVVKGTPKVTVAAPGCAVVVRGWDKSEVQYRVTQFADPRNSEPLKMSEDHNDTSVNIRVENPNRDARQGMFFDNARQVRVEVFVPRKSNLQITTNGEIRIDGVSGEVDLKGADEAINIRDTEGKLHITNADGRIRVIGFKGEVVAQTDDGAISLEGDFTSLKANTTDGAIVLTLPESTSAIIEANCDAVKSEGIALDRISTDENKSRYKIGKGGSLFQVSTGGEIRVRGAGALKETF